jgi:DNA-binding CsgD family transcriptional regulator
MRPLRSSSVSMTCECCWNELKAGPAVCTWQRFLCAAGPTRGSSYVSSRADTAPSETFWHGLTTAPQSSFADLASGAVYAAQGRLEEARNVLERALQSRRRWPGINPWATLENLLRLAPVLQDLGNKPRAATLLAEAREVLASFPDGARVQLDRLERLERRLERPGPAGAAAKRLTPREEVVLRLLRGTLSLREIAQELYVSTNTVKSHTRAIYRKLGVSGRPDAIVRSRELGIL